MNIIWLIGRFLLFFFLQNEEKKLVKRTQVKGVLIYLKTVNNVRRSLMMGLGLIFAFQIVVFAFFGMMICGLWLTPIELETKIWIAFGVSSCLFLIPLAICLYCFQEKIWFKVSQAEQWIDKVEKAS